MNIIAIMMIVLMMMMLMIVIGIMMVMMMMAYANNIQLLAKPPLIWCTYTCQISVDVLWVILSNNNIKTNMKTCKYNIPICWKLL